MAFEALIAAAAPAFILAQAAGTLAAVALFGWLLRPLDGTQASLQAGAGDGPALPRAKP